MILLQLVLQQALSNPQHFRGPDLDLAALVQGPADHLFLDAVQGLGERDIRGDEAVDIQSRLRGRGRQFLGQVLGGVPLAFSYTSTIFFALSQAPPAFAMKIAW